MYIYKMSRNKLLLVLFCAALFATCSGGYAQNLKKNNKTIALKKPQYLKPGDTVAIVAPSGVLKNRKAEVNRAIALLKSWGLHAVVGDHVFAQDYHFAGTDEARCEDFQEALDNQSIRAIWCARGGYGAVRILDRLDYTKFKTNPKWIIGYSDITAIHNQVQSLGYQSIHGMMCTSLQDDPLSIKETIQTFKNALFGKGLNYSLKGSKYNREGAVVAPIVGGNLTILHSMLGSSTSLDTTGRILFIEEIGEYRYHIDRMLQSLKRSGYFNHCKGVIIGDFTKTKNNTTPWGVSTQQLILDVLADYNFPVAFNMPAGHAKDNRSLLFGATVSLEVTTNSSNLNFK